MYSVLTGPIFQCRRQTNDVYYAIKTTGCDHTGSLCLNVLSTPTLPEANFISKTNAELMQVALIGRK